MPATPRSVALWKQDADDLRAGQVGEGLGEQRHGAGDRRGREAGPRPQILRTVLIGRAVVIADRRRDTIRPASRPVREGRNLSTSSTPPAPSLTPTEPAMITMPGKPAPGLSANGSGLAMPSLPAEMTRITTRVDGALHRAASNSDPGVDPPSDRLMTARRPATARSMPDRRSRRRRTRSRCGWRRCRARRRAD